ncbi:hypothetical protein V492_03879 [Pseudogymnoascus sp. VKM F-4246]|nr:hypothetical protein V492_03879 [Pseudogymnoascus sp. VKM F-4246]
MNENHARLSPALVETCAGLSAGAISTLVVHPLDIIKTRLQIHRTHISHTPTTSLTLARSLLTHPHPLTSLYRGLTPNLLGNSASWALFFYFKSLVETPLSLHRARHSSALTPGDYFLTSLGAGLLTTLATNPIWVLKTRMLSTDRGALGAYPSMWAGARAIARTEGWRGFYRGMGASCLGVSHGAVQFGVYEPMKRAWLAYAARRGWEGEEKGKMGYEATLVISGGAKMVAGCATYPYQVVRARLQTYNAEARFGRGIMGVVGRLWREEGVRGFYRGLGLNMVRVLPATWVTFLVYENVRYYLPRANL